MLVSYFEPFTLSIVQVMPDTVVIEAKFSSIFPLKLLYLGQFLTKNDK